MSRERETRAAPIVGVKGDGRTIEARAVTYNVIDDFKTRFKPGVFSDSLRRRLPRLTWHHDWTDVVGVVTGYDDRSDGLYITGRLSDPDAVPRARQAMAQLAEGVIDQVSVGFVREASREAADGIVDITKAVLSEIALVLEGAVPGAEVLAVRSRDRVAEVVAALRNNRRPARAPIQVDARTREVERLADLALRLVDERISDIDRLDLYRRIDAQQERLRRLGLG